MSEIILWSLLAFFGTFGIVEFIRFLYTDLNCSQKDFHVVVCADKFKDNIEIAVRNALLATDTCSLIVIMDSPSAEDMEVYEKLLKKYSFIRLMSTEEYIEYIRNREC